MYLTSLRGRMAQWPWHWPGTWEPCVQVLALPQSHCVTLGNSLSLRASIPVCPAGVRALPCPLGVHEGKCMKLGGAQILPSYIGAQISILTVKGIYSMSAAPRFCHPPGTASPRACLPFFDFPLFPFSPCCDPSLREPHFPKGKQNTLQAWPEPPFLPHVPLHPTFLTKVSVPFALGDKCPLLPKKVGSPGTCLKKGTCPSQNGDVGSPYPSSSVRRH